MKSGQKSKLHIENYKWATSLILLILLMSLLLPLVSQSDEGTQTIFGRVDRINSDSLFMNGKEYPIARNVKVTISAERSIDVTLGTITSAGFIKKARIYLEQGYVTRILIMEVEQ